MNPCCGCSSMDRALCLGGFGILGGIWVMLSTQHPGQANSSDVCVKCCRVLVLRLQSH